MSFLGLASLYAMRVNLSVAIVAMVNAGKFEVLPIIEVVELTDE